MFARKQLAVLLATFAGLTGYAAKPALADPAVYEKLVDASVWIVNPEGDCTGSGVVVDAERQLIVTNYHVVGEAKEVAIFFAAFDGEGELVTKRSSYLDNFTQLKEQKMACVAKVIGVWKEKDLALVQLSGCPVDLTALPMAEKSAVPGETLHAVGNPGASQALWVYSPGMARQVHDLTMSYEGGQQIRTRILQTTAPINPGDSGGAIVNGRGELVGINCGGVTKARLISFAIDITVVRKFLDSYAGNNANQVAKTDLIVGWPQ